MEVGLTRVVRGLLPAINSGVSSGKRDTYIAASHCKHACEQCPVEIYAGVTAELCYKKPPAMVPGQYNEHCLHRLVHGAVYCHRR